MVVCQIVSNPVIAQSRRSVPFVRPRMGDCPFVFFRANVDSGLKEKQTKEEKQTEKEKYMEKVEQAKMKQQAAEQQQVRMQMSAKRQEMIMAEN